MFGKECAGMIKKRMKRRAKSGMNVWTIVFMDDNKKNEKKGKKL